MKFQKFRKIGEGSCSKVYRAYDLNRREDIAIKVLGGVKFILFFLVYRHGHIKKLWVIDDCK